jgi:glycosyltransferase involved in cell wall biosynthesis
MKILLVNKYHFIQGGADRAYLDMADILTRAGHEVAFFSMHHPKNLPTKWSKYFVSFVDYDDSRNVGMLEKLRMALQILWNREAERNMERLIQDFRPDVVHVHTQLGVGLAAIAAANKLTIPVVATNHVMPVNITKNVRLITPFARPVSAIFTRYGMLLYRGAKQVIMPTQSAVDMFDKAAIDIPMQAISNGIDLHRYRPLKPKKSILKKYNIPQDVPIVSYVGRLDREKHVHILIAAMAKVLKEMPAHSLIIGDGNAVETLHTLVYKLGIEKYVTFTGRVSDDNLVELHRAGTLFVMPSPAELQSLALLEAMASGKAVVAVNAGALPELCQDGRNGRIATVDDPHDMAHKIMQLLQDDQLRKKYAKESIAIAKTHDLKQVIKKFERIYEEVCR